MTTLPVIFVSSSNPDDEMTRGLAARLRQSGFLVSTSPRKTVSDDAAKWLDWYSGGLDRTIADAAACVIVVGDKWATSDWIAEEAETAFRAAEQGSLRQLFFMAAPSVSLAGIPENRRKYLRVELPRELGEAVRAIKNAIVRDGEQSET